jgi:hypothetical protein
MALGILWFVRAPADGAAWAIDASSPSTWLPPIDYVVDFLPGLVAFGIGLTIMVAPLTTTVMTSIPSRHAGVASAINNAVSRVGPQLAGALVFIAVAASFVAGVEDRVPIDAASRTELAALNPPPDGASPELRRAVRASSTDAFHLAMAVSAGLLVAGAVVNGVGIRDRDVVEQPSTATVDGALSGAPSGERG